ncbi:MAG: hypothetical protein AAF327_12020 [Cyanobacteria bacterium P01_A01_bin.37]
MSSLWATARLNSIAGSAANLFDGCHRHLHDCGLMWRPAAHWPAVTDVRTQPVQSRWLHNDCTQGGCLSAKDSHGHGLLGVTQPCDRHIVVFPWVSLLQSVFNRPEERRPHGKHVQLQFIARLCANSTIGAVSMGQSIVASATTTTPMMTMSIERYRGMYQGIRVFLGGDRRLRSGADDWIPIGLQSISIPI